MPSAKTRKKKNKNQASVVEEPEVGNGSDMEGVTSRRPSHGRELSPEPQDVPPQKKKRRKKASTLDVEGEQPDVSNGNMVESPADVDEGRRKSRRKRKPKMADLHYTNELSVEEDDVISDSAPAPAPPAFRQALFSAPPGPSQPMAKVFMEKGRRFQASERVEGPRHAEQMEHLDFMEMQPLWCTKDVALKVHSSFRVLGLFCHGFLAGYAVWNIIVVYVLAGEELSTLSNLLQQYHALAYPAQSLLYLLLAISTVSAFDRVNLAKTSLALRGFLTLDSTAVASALYFIALVLSLSQQMTSDRINLYPEANQTLWPQGDEQRILGPWIAVNLVVALLVGLAWVCISTQPETDYTEEFLMAMEVEEFRHDGMDVKP